MHKIKKGIKKKIKGKKDKDDELFTPEEYERYKKQKEEELRLQQEQLQDVPTEDHIEENNEDRQEEEQEPARDSPEEGAGKEDWRSFFSATDTVLKKTTVNLEQIKESSFFQVKKTEETSELKSRGSSPVPYSGQAKTWVDLDKGGIDDAVEDEGKERKLSQEEKAGEAEEKPKPEQPVKDIVLKPIEDIPIVSEEDFADVFDTTYVDAVEGGEIQLYQIPDSPIFEDLNEPDPFDTSNVEKVLHIEKEKPKEVPVKPQPKEQKKKKKNLVNLGCAVEVLTGKASTDTDLPKKKDTKQEINLLADFTDNFNEGEKDRNGEKENINDQLIESQGTTEENETNKEKSALEDLLFGEDEHTDLPDIVFPLPVSKASEEKEKSEEKDPKEDLKHLDEDLTADLDPLLSNEEPINKKESHLQDLVAEFDIINESETSSKPVIPVESKAIDDDIKDEFDAEFAAIAAESIAKEKEKAIDEIGVLDDNDPFDTSSVSKLIGESENKDLILQSTEEKEEDPFETDFATQFIKNQEKPSRPPRPELPKTDKSDPLSLLEEDPFDTSAAAKVLPSDPFEAVEDSISLPESLQPQSASHNVEESDNFDPFDTSLANTFGKTELKVLEGELLSDISQGKSDLDFDFNPREEETKSVPPLRPPSPACFLSGDTETSEAPVLTPQTAAACETDNFDPFDTSIAEKVQIKSLEEELLSNSLATSSKTPPPRPVSPSCILSSITSESRSANQLHSIAKKALAEDFDPFDTSIADHFGSENNTDFLPSLKSTSDNLELNLKPPRPSSPACLLATTPTDENPTLQPTTDTITQEKEEIDPFDTSIAEQFGKTELKVLETELLSNADKEVVIDDDFDPRSEESKRSKSKPPPRPVSPACLLTSNNSEVEQKLPPLSPITKKERLNSEEIGGDPFDTSIANKLGRTEIQRLESELLTDVEKTDKPNISKNIPTRPLPPASECIFATTHTDNNPALQPFYKEPTPKEGDTFDDIDPFDTSIADQFGKTELKVLEESLLNEPQPNLVPDNQESALLNTSVTYNDHLFDISPSAENLPVLKPTNNTKKVCLEEADPFDTSIASKFGKTELKVLESELLIDSGIKRDLSDEEFGPEETEIKTLKQTTPSSEFSHNILESKLSFTKESSPSLDPFTSLEQSEEDPFDTSVVDNIVADSKHFNREF